MGKYRKTVSHWIIVLLFGVVCFVLGWLWGDRPNALGNIRVLDVLIAVGTIGSAVVALILGGKELKWKAEERDRVKLSIRVYAINLTYDLLAKERLFEEVRIALESIRVDGIEKNDLDIRPLNELTNFLIKVDFDKLAIIFLSEAHALTKSLQQLSLIRLLYPYRGLEAHQAYHRSNVSLDALQKANELYKEAYTALLVMSHKELD